MSFEITQISDAHHRDFIRDRTSVVVSIDNQLLDRIIASSAIDAVDVEGLGEKALEAAAEWRANERIRRAGAKARA